MKKGKTKIEPIDVRATLKLLPEWVKERERRAKKKIKDEKKYFVKVIEHLEKSERQK